ncbi:paeninodin family lasso peptide [Peribacillus psychrosaccharolyticus]|uniref:paeninodin family lasso peptide n=1 Tax=Peribacillus psychrosaccharolyticus TaxID=1407 RepID=UPI003D2BA1EC
MKKEWTNPEIEILDVRLTMKGIGGGGGNGGGNGGGHGGGGGGGGKGPCGHKGHHGTCPTPTVPPDLDS